VVLIAVFEFFKHLVILNVFANVWANIVQMMALLIIYKVFSHELPEVNRTYRWVAVLVGVFTALNIAFFIASILSRKKFILCRKDFPNSIAGIGVKFLLLLFDIAVFVMRCCSWCVRTE
jgi:hypothetical protein